MWYREKSRRFILEFIVAGDVEFESDEKKNLLGKDTVYVIHKGSRQHYATGPSGFALKRAVWIEGPLLESILHVSGLDRKTIVSLDNPTAVRSIYKRIHLLLSDLPDGFEKELSALAYSLLSELWRQSGAYCPEFIVDIKEYLRNNVARKFRAGDLRELTGLSIPFVYRSFRKWVGTTPFHFHLVEKMNAADELIKGGDLSIKEIGWRFGYKDSSFFTRQYKQVFGKTPGSGR